MIHAQSWEEMGAGSGSPPGLFVLSNYDPSVDPNTTREIYPELQQLPGGQLSLILQSNTTDQLINEGEVRLFKYQGSWTIDPSTSSSDALGVVKASVGRAPSSAVGDGVLGVTTTGSFPQSGAVDVYASFLDGESWAGKGDSLEMGGLTDVDTFQDQPNRSALGIDDFGIPYVAYSRGITSRREIFVQRFLGTMWQGIANSDITPIAPSTTMTMTNQLPAIGFSGGAPVVAWTERKTGSEIIRLLRYSSNSDSWEELENSFSIGLGTGRRPKIVSLPGRNSFYLAYENYFTRDLVVLEWNGNSFLDRGNPLAPWGLANIAPFNDASPTQTFPDVASFDIALDTAGRPAIAFRASTISTPDKYHIFVSYRDGQGVWQDLGDPQTGLGSSDLNYSLQNVPSPPYGHFAPSISIGLDNRPVIAWQFQSIPESIAPILVKRYSEPVNTNTPNSQLAFEQLRAVLLGNIDPNDSLKEQLDDNVDGVLDAADLARIVNRL